VSREHPAIAALHAQAAAWNRGDLDGYLHRVHPDVVYVGADGPVHGRAALSARYRQRFASPEAMGTLSVTVLDVEPGEQQLSAVVAWALPEAHGTALVVFVETAAGWLLRYDATVGLST